MRAGAEGEGPACPLLTVSLCPPPGPHTAGFVFPTHTGLPLEHPLQPPQTLLG